MGFIFVSYFFRVLSALVMYRLVQKDCPLFEFPSALLPANLGQPMHSQLALTELPSLNLAPFILLNPVRTAISEGRRNTCIEEREEAPSLPPSIPLSLFAQGHSHKSKVVAGRQAGRHSGRHKARRGACERLLPQIVNTLFCTQREGTEYP